MKSKRKYSLIAFFIVIMLIFSSCGKKEGDNSDGGKTREITLQMQLPESLDPLVAEQKSVRDALSLCYEPLFRLDSQMNPLPVLASAITMSEDCTEAIVSLKDSVLWHDGTSFTSADVAYTINLIKATAKSPYYGCVEYIADVQAIDPLSLKLILSRPYGQIVYSLYFPVVSAHNTSLGENIIGTGPYEYDNYTPAANLKLKRFEGYHEGAAATKTASVKVVRETEFAAHAFNSGSINAITGDSFDLLNSVPKANSRLTQYPSLKYEFLAYNHKNGLFSNAAIRAAVASAIDRTPIVKEVYAGAANEANAPIHPMATDMSGISTGIQYNLANAEETLFLEGFSKNEESQVLYNGTGRALSFTLLVNKENSRRIKTANMLCSQLFLAGMEVKVEETDFATYVSRIESGSYDAYLGGVTFSNLYDYEFFLSNGGSMNNFGYSSEYMDAALAAVKTASGKEALMSALLNFDEVFLKEQPVCGIVFCKDTLITAQNIMGKLVPLAGAPYANINGWSAK